MVTLFSLFLTSTAHAQAEWRLEQTFAGFAAPTAIVMDNNGHLYISNWSNGTITKLDRNGNKSLFASDMAAPAGLAFDRQGNLLAADYRQNVIYKISPTGVKSIFAQDNLATPTGISFSGSGELRVANRGSNEIIALDSDGNLKRVIARGLDTPVGITEATDGTIYVSNYGGGISRITPSSLMLNFSREFTSPGVDMAWHDNHLYVVDNGADCVRLLRADGTTLTVLDNIKGAVALFIDPRGNMYVGSWTEGNIYKYVK